LKNQLKDEKHFVMLMRDFWK